MLKILIFANIEKVDISCIENKKVVIATFILINQALLKLTNNKSLHRKTTCSVLVGFLHTIY